LDSASLQARVGGQEDAASTASVRLPSLGLRSMVYTSRRPRHPPTTARIRARAPSVLRQSKGLHRAHCRPLAPAGGVRGESSRDPPHPCSWLRCKPLARLVFHRTRALAPAHAEHGHVSVVTASLGRQERQGGRGGGISATRLSAAGARSQ
jgi:hypothetical protein